MGDERMSDNESIAKSQLFQATLAKVNQMVARPLDETEAKALAFLIDKRSGGNLDSQAFISDVLKVTSGLSPRDVAWRIYSAIYEAKGDEVQKLRQQNPQNDEVLRAAASYERLFKLGHDAKLTKYQSGTGKITIGAVPRHWDPKWLNPKK